MPLHRGLHILEGSESTRNRCPSLLSAANIPAHTDVSPGIKHTQKIMSVHDTFLAHLLSMHS